MGKSIMDWAGKHLNLSLLFTGIIINAPLNIIMKYHQTGNWVFIMALAAFVIYAKIWWWVLSKKHRNHLWMILPMIFCLVLIYMGFADTAIWVLTISVLNTFNLLNKSKVHQNVKTG